MVSYLMFLQNHILATAGFCNSVNERGKNLLLTAALYKMLHSDFSMIRFMKESNSPDLILLALL